MHVFIKLPLHVRWFTLYLTDRFQVTNLPMSMEHILVPTIADEHLQESQCGFMANRGTTDMVFAL